MNMLAVESGIHLGPGRVMAVEDTPGWVRLEIADQGFCRARIAVAAPYSPAEGDEVLVLRQGEDVPYIVGVLEVAGRTCWRVPGDLDLQANGAIRIRAGTALKLEGAQNVEVAAPCATVRASRLNLLAATLVQRVGNLLTWASGLLQTRSERLRQVTKQGWFVRAGRGHIKTADNMSINGKTIHLG